MRMAKLQCVSPGGQTITFDAANGGAGLSIYREASFIEIRDHGLPPMAHGESRMIGQIPTSWALIPEWEITGE